METDVESAPSRLDGDRQRLSVRLLGPLEIVRDGVPVALAGSAPAACRCLPIWRWRRTPWGAAGCANCWMLPNDPRGELRWCLSKLRAALGTPAGAVAATMALRRAQLTVRRRRAAPAASPPGDRHAHAGAAAGAFAGHFAGDLLDGLELERSPLFDSWLTAQRRRFHTCHAAVLEQLVASLPADGNEAVAHLDTWVELAPFDGRAHAALLASLARRGEIGAAEQHLASAERLFQSEDLDFAPLRAAWRAIRDQRASQAQPACLSTISQLVATSGDAGPVEPSHASLAVMPFVDESGARGGLADGFTHDIITRLAKLRDFFVIARGSVFALAEKTIAPEEPAENLASTMSPPARCAARPAA